MTGRCSILCLYSISNSASVSSVSRTSSLRSWKMEWPTAKTESLWRHCGLSHFPALPTHTHTRTHTSRNCHDSFGWDPSSPRTTTNSAAFCRSSALIGRERRENFSSWAAFLAPVNWRESSVGRLNVKMLKMLFCTVQQDLTCLLKGVTVKPMLMTDHSDLLCASSTQMAVTLLLFLISHFLLNTA